MPPSELEKLLADRDLEISALKLKLEFANARVGEAHLERDRAQSNLAKVTICLAETQQHLHEVMSRDAIFLKELNALRSLVDAHQEEVQTLIEARRQVQGLCDELRQENERLREEDRNADADIPADRPVMQPMRLVNVAR